MTPNDFFFDVACSSLDGHAGGFDLAVEDDDYFEGFFFEAGGGDAPEGGVFVDDVDDG